MSWYQNIESQLKVSVPGESVVAVAPAFELGALSSAQTFCLLLLYSTCHTKHVLCYREPQITVT